MSDAANLDTRFAQAMGALLGPEFPDKIALAVSGGGDSMAMLALCHGWARVWGVALHVVTIDHGLRRESADEAALVARECETLGHPHHILDWQWDGQGNTQDAARRARLSLIDAWRGEIAHVLMAHTADDVAETFLMRLARGSGVDGLAAMQARHHTPHGFHIIRPCLAMGRAELRHFAKTLHIPWADDPTNDDPKYDRARARAMLGQLAGLGLTQGDLTTTAQRMARARDALRARACDIAEKALRPDLPGMVALERAVFERTERDTQMRLLAAALMWVSGAQYRPRAASLEGLLDRLLGGGAGTLIGAHAQMQTDTCLIFREFAAVQDLCGAADRPWDARWHLRGPITAELELRALGEAINEIPDWRATGQPRAALMASPAVFRNDALIAAPVAGHNAAFTAEIKIPFTSYLLSH